MEMLIVKENSPEYDYMWGWLANHPLNKELEDPMVAYHDGGTWQYMGSFKQGTKAVHEFRHRCHPTTLNRVDLKVSASSWFNDEDIEKRYTVKN